MTPRSTVLIVDDSLTVRMDLADAFSEAGLEVVPCGTAEEARQAFSSRPIDIIVLDILLPDGDSIELLRELRAGATGPTPPVLVLSTEAEVKDRIRGLQTGADEFVGKPYDRTYVVAKARELLRLRQLPEARRRPTILVIDDSPTFREELRAALVAAGHDVSTAPTGEEGLRLAAAIRPTAILVDGVLPGIDGATVVRRLRLDAALRRTPCLMLTASEGKGAEVRALDAGADGYVRKEEEMGVILARVAGLLRSSSATEEERTASVLAPKRILAVDDSVTYLEEVASALRQEGYDVVLAHSGEEALALLAVQPVDCVLLDVMMPGLSGQETCRRIKAAPGTRDIPLILLTAIENREVMIDGLATGADDYISKSSEFEVLKARIAAQLRRRQFEDETRRMRAELYPRGPGRRAGAGQQGAGGLQLLGVPRPSGTPAGGQRLHGHPAPRPCLGPVGHGPGAPSERDSRRGADGPAHRGPAPLRAPEPPTAEQRDRRYGGPRSRGPGGIAG